MKSLATKVNPAIIFDRIFRKTIFLEPTPERVFNAVNITGEVGKYENNDNGATILSPSLIVPVRGLKNVRQICFKRYGSTALANMFDDNSGVVRATCPECNKEITLLTSQDNQLTEKTLADMLDIAETAGRMQAEGNDPSKMENQMKIMLMLAAGALLIGVLIYFKVKGGG